jgi:lysophospholipid acyltransferase (LPLAT)-like uncharacterized protein
MSGLHHFEEAQASGKPIVMVAWHGMTMMLVGVFSDLVDLGNVVLIVPDDWRGDALSVFSRRLGARPYPMNLTGERTMSAARQLVHLVREVKQGAYCYITPDGPDGPAYHIKPGVVFIAQRANALILPMGAYARHGYRLNRWDRYVVPYPFSRISTQIAPPISLAAGEGEPSEVIDRLTAALHRATAQAAANYYEVVP